MARESDDGIPIRRHTARRKIQAPHLLGLLLLAITGSALAVVAYFAFTKKTTDDRARNLSGDFEDVQPPPALGAEKWAARDLVDHMNGRDGGGKYRLVNIHGGTYITTADEETIWNYKHQDAKWHLADGDENFLWVGRYETSEEARQVAGKLEFERSWQWGHFVFMAPDVDRGVSGRLKRAIIR